MPVSDEKTYIITVAQADFLTDTDILEGLEWASKGFNRTITKMALVGSTNPNDIGLAIRVGGTKQTDIVNTTGGANVSPKRDDFKYQKIKLPKGELLQAVATANAVANDVVFEINIGRYTKPKKSKPRSGYSRGRYYPSSRRR